MPFLSPLLASRGPRLPGGRRVISTLRAAPRYQIKGVTRDAAGNPLGNCTVDLFYTATNMLAATVQSDASGNFSFLIGPSLACYIVAYQAGSPDLAGTTVNTLLAAAS